ncbi:hypothetical protein A9X05_09050 [Mycobacterium sp. E3298]|nr:hypothetical protein A9X05_09050 [Mycobacterium sp. E3298]
MYLSNKFSPINLSSKETLKFFINLDALIASRNGQASTIKTLTTNVIRTGSNGGYREQLVIFNHENWLITMRNIAIFYKLSKLIFNTLKDCDI